ncbi:MAG: hypothetical protein ABIN91_14415, partial [Mucilaginibacter sp.]|uniref:hypothetical protein n=1 Tax=Mucilaginibacter sp. TaxID=1882438 RepID=UPI003264C899
AFVEEAQESRTKNQEEEGFVVNGDGELVAEAAIEDAVMQVDDVDVLEGSSATAGKILTLSPPVDTVFAGVGYTRVGRDL